MKYQIDVLKLGSRVSNRSNPVASFSSFFIPQVSYSNISDPDMLHFTVTFGKQ